MYFGESNDKNNENNEMKKADSQFKSNSLFNQLKAFTIMYLNK